MSYMSVKLRNIAGADRMSEEDRDVLHEAAELFDEQNMDEAAAFLLRDADCLRAGLHVLGNNEMGRVVAVLLGVLIDRGIDLRTFLPSLKTSILDDPVISADLRVLGER